ncbi:MAG: bifunctional nicotinamidase/pyrazinamidase [Chloroflexi bacterium]|nr:bifunctional nicotinamidase/pyrazinamidase [Chloroflexota bacterium]
MAEKPVLLVVDPQNDFCPGGALAVPEGDQVVPVLNEYIRRFREAGLPIIATRDWHPAQTRHFTSGGGVWPPHCIQDTPGAAFRSDLYLPPDTPIISKGTHPDEDAYSAFQGKDKQGRDLTTLLRELGVTEIYIGGLATDYCVRSSTLDALKQGFRTTVLEDAIRGVDLQPEDSQRALEEMDRAGARRIRLAEAREALAATR